MTPAPGMCALATKSYFNIDFFEEKILDFFEIYTFFMCTFGILYTKVSVRAAISVCTFNFYVLGYTMYRKN